MDDDNDGERGWLMCLRRINIRLKFLPSIGENVQFEDISISLSPHFLSSLFLQNLYE